jgi:ABC-type transport auxiliary lipoprotein component
MDNYDARSAEVSGCLCLPTSPQPVGTPLPACGPFAFEAAVLREKRCCSGTPLTLCPLVRWTLPRRIAYEPGKAGWSTILVANIAASGSMQDARIRYRSGADEEGVYELHYWTEPPAAMVRDGLIQALRSSGKYQRVLESSSSAVGDFLVHVRLHEFDEVD